MFRLPVRGPASPSQHTLPALLVTVLVTTALSGALGAQGQPQSQTPPSGSTVPAPASTPAPSDATDETPRFLDTVTVSATLNPVTVKETPGTVTVIDSATIQRQLMQNTADLFKYEPGIYVETVANRVGVNGVNIRGVGGNRVMTQVDGVETSEQFDFGPFNVHQFALDLDSLKSAEVVRSAGSALYGSDALGGVVSFFTKDPVDYLPANQRFRLAGKTLYDGRARNSHSNLVLAGGRPRAQGSLFVGYAAGNEPINKGTVDTENAARTTLNPQDRQSLQLLGKIVVRAGDDNVLRGTVETADTDVETEAFSSRTATVRDIDSDDTMRRRRGSIDQALSNRFGLNTLSWSLYGQTSNTDQIVSETQVTTISFQRSGTLAYSQDTFGGTLQGRKALTAAPMLLTFGGTYKRNTFDMLRDRLDINTATGAVIPATNLILPSKYFPESTVGETGAYLQAESKFSRLTLVTGLRYDRFTMNADETDAVYIATLSPTAADFEADRVSARVGAAFSVSRVLTLHTQYAGGFRAPPYSAINSGFTNLLGGYTSIPNTDLSPETSNNVEFGARAGAARASLGVTGFWNSYDDFIIQAQRGMNPVTRLLEFQYQNLSTVLIRGVEFQGDAVLAPNLRVRAAYAVIRGDDTSGAVDVPLNTVAPDQGTIGLQYTATRWGGDLSLRTARGQTQERAGAGLFAPEGYAVLDLTGWTALTRSLTLRGGLLNLTDRKYFEWPNVRGRQATDPLIDRYTSPGIGGLLSVSYGW